MSRTARNLIRLLEKERALLRGGNLAEAAALLPRKVELAEKLEHDGATPEVLVDLRAAAERNMPLLEAARKGARSAQKVVRALAGGVRTQTYSAAGRTTAIGGGDGRRLERRA